MKYLKLYESYCPFEIALKKMAKENEDAAKAGFKMTDPHGIVFLIHLAVNLGVTSKHLSMEEYDAMDKSIPTTDEFAKLSHEEQLVVDRFDKTLRYLVATHLLENDHIIEKYKNISDPDFEIYWKFHTPERTPLVSVDIYSNSIWMWKLQFPHAELANPTTYAKTSRFDL